VAATRAEFEAAVAAYWGARDDQLTASAISGAVGTGTAGSVRGGRHFTAMTALLARFFLDAGYPLDAIRTSRLGLPGYYRPQKQWDLVVVHNDTLVAAFELKSLGGPSFGNNYNNRIEEALGSAVDLHRAGRAGVIPGERPWLGYLFLMQDAKGSREPVHLAEGVFAVDPVWRGHRSYQERFSVFCERLLAEGLYDAVCYLVSSPADPTPVEPVVALDWRHFAAAIQARITYLAALGFPGSWASHA
jgi:hypothetical protein